MIKIDENHYIIKLIREMIPYGIERMKLGEITVSLLYPDDDINIFTLSLINDNIKKGVAFTLLKNPVNTTIIESKVCGREVQFEQQVTISNSSI